MCMATFAAWRRHHLVMSLCALGVPVRPSSFSRQWTSQAALRATLWSECSPWGLRVELCVSLILTLGLHRSY